MKIKSVKLLEVNGVWVWILIIKENGKLDTEVVLSCNEMKFIIDNISSLPIDAQVYMEICNDSIGIKHRGVLMFYGNRLKHFSKGSVECTFIVRHILNVYTEEMSNISDYIDNM